MAKINVSEFLESLKEMTVLELNELVKAIEEEFGVTAAAPVAVAAGPAEAVEEGPKSYNVVLKEIGPNKIAVIKVVRELTGFGAPSTKSLASFNPNPVTSRTSLITFNLLAPGCFKITDTSDGPVSSTAAGPAATATGAAAVTPNSSSIALTNSFNSNTLISLIAAIKSAVLIFAISFVPPINDLFFFF